jgi:hypothetical protein
MNEQTLTGAPESECESEPAPPMKRRRSPRSTARLSKAVQCAQQRLTATDPLEDDGCPYKPGAPF